MAEHDFDLFVIGAGSGGVRAARFSASHGARVAVAEDRYLGGTCVNVGCIPKKLFVYASHFAEDFEAATRGYGWSMDPARFDWRTLIENKDREISHLNDVYAKLLDEAGVERVWGRAVVADPNTVVVGDDRYSARHILIATGSWPYLPDLPGRELAISSNEAFYLPELPRRVLVVGGGYIAVEFAGIWNGMGSEVTQIYRGPLFLRGFDGDVRKVLAEELPKKGIDLRFDCNVVSIEKGEGGLVVHLTDESRIEVDTVLMATGRRPVTADLGLEEAGVALDEVGAVVVDDYSQSSVPSIHAVGDATNRINLTPVALHEAGCLAWTLFGGKPTAPVHENVAAAVFSQPPVGTVGLSEEEARERHASIDVYRSRFRALKHTLTGTDETTMMKLVVDRASDRVLGVHMVGADAGEIIQGFAVALKCGATKAQFDETIGIHPTSAEEFVTLREPVSE